MVDACTSQPALSPQPGEMNTDSQLSLTLPGALGAFLPLSPSAEWSTLHPAVLLVAMVWHQPQGMGGAELWLCQHFLPARFGEVRSTPDEATDPGSVSLRREICLTWGSGTSPRLLLPSAVLPVQITAC